jgi:hypothetical protein
MKPSSNIFLSLLKPRALINMSYFCQSSKIQFEDLLITPLKPNNHEHFETFKQILTSEKIVFTSSWIDKWFGIEQLKKRCDFMSKKLDMIANGDLEINLPKDVIDASNKGVSPAQIALNRFFMIEENRTKLRKIYLEMTDRVEETGLGYYKFEDKNLDIVGGGSLAPISKDAKMVDIALHILKPKQGIGSYCLEKLLDIAFNEKGVDQVWGSSIINHPGTPTLCAKHGMIIRNIGDMKYYFIDSKMREATKGKAEKMMDLNPMAASIYYGKDNDISNSNRCR